MRRAILALDQGGHASRACLVDQSGEILVERQIPIDTALGVDGTVEHDADEIVASLLRAADSAIRDADDVSIEAAGLAVQRSTIVCFERHSGAPLSPAISWQDRRNARWLESFAPHADRISAITGLPLSAHYGVGKMRWCLDHLPSVQRAQQHATLNIAPLASFLAMRLTAGAAVVDPANASRTLLWDSARRDWSPELLNLFGIDGALLPPCSWTRGEFGQLQLGRSAIALRAVTGDQSAVVFAFGAPDSRALYINLGTGAFIQRPLTARPTHSAPLLGSVLSADAHTALYSLEGTVNGAGSAISALLQQYNLPQAQLWQQLEQLPAAASLPIYINGIGGLGSPYWRANQPSYFIGDGSALERFAAVLESVLFLIAINFELMRERGGELERVILSGGLSRSSWLCRRLAAVLGVPVLQAAQQATVLGIAALAAPAGWLSSTLRAPPTRFDAAALPAAELAALTARRRDFQAALSA